MTTEALKSAAITNSDATPVVNNTSGEGGPYIVREADGFVTTTTGKTSGSTYRIARVPTTIKVKRVALESAALGSSTAVDVGVYYSDSTVDGTAVANQGAVVDQDFFASAVDVSSAVAPTDVTNESGTYTLDKRIQPLWQAVGLSANPGGYFDIVLTNTATINTGGRIGLRVAFAD